ncbi:hypothetical protein STEG23_000728 [Scotinomys teguina]
MQAVNAVHSSPPAASAGELRGNPQPLRRANCLTPGVPMQRPGAAASARHASTDREGRHRLSYCRSRPARAMEGAGEASAGPRAVPRPSQVQGEFSKDDSNLIPSTSGNISTNKKTIYKTEESPKSRIRKQNPRRTKALCAFCPGVSSDTLTVGFSMFSPPHQPSYQIPPLPDQPLS